MKKYLILLLFNLIFLTSFGKNIVITSIQPLYSIVSILTDGTDIQSFTPFESDTSMTMSKEAIQDQEFNLDIAKEAQAVVDISSIWKEDVIYGKARQKNIHIIEIDASHNYDETKPTLFFTDYSDGSINPYIWLSNQNILKMANIIAGDLEKIYPQNKNKIENNLLEFSKDIRIQSKEIQKSLLKVNSTEVISLSENLQYFLNDLNLYIINLPYSKINAKNVAEIINENNIKTIVSDRWLKKDIIKAIEDAGGHFVFINTLDIPYDDDDKMDKLAVLKNYKENSNRLIKALK